MPPLQVQDFLVDGQPHGDLANEFADSGYNSGVWRPYLDRNGNKCVTVNVGKQYDPKKGREVPTREKMTLNEARFRGYDAPTLYLSNATILRKDEWIMFDRVVVESARQRLRAWADLAAANTLTLDGMSNEMLEHETINDPGQASVDMDGLSDGTADSVLYQLEGMPLPFTYESFFFSERKLAVSRKSGRPLSSLMASICGRRVAETIEKTTLGVLAGMLYGTSSNYSRAPQVVGYTNQPQRNTATLTTPTGSNSATTVSEILGMRSTLYDDGFYGPFVCYNGTDWDRYLDDDHFKYVTSGGAAPNGTLRQRLTQIEDIAAVRRADYLTPTLTGGTFDFIMVSLSRPEVCRAIIGMPIKVLQWPSRGSMQMNFKVICIMAPQVRADYSGNSGINHASVT
jgi:hypothetical protein